MKRVALFRSFVSVSFVSLVFATFASLATFGACGGSKNGNGPDGGAGVDGAMQCSPDGVTQCVGATYETCSGGAWTVSKQCTTACDPTLGCVACEPGTDYCVGEDVHSCTADGQDGGLVMSCTGNQTCSGGTCADPCAQAAQNRSYIGCEYWAVDLDNALEVFTTPDQAEDLGGCSGLGATELDNVRVCYDPNNENPDPNNPFGSAVTEGLCDEPGDVCPNPDSSDNYSCQTETICGLDAQHSPFAIVVSNPQSKPVDVTITDATGMTSTTTVAAGAVTALFPQQLGFADHSMDWTEQTKNAYKVTSTAPIVAYQYNPLDNVGVFSNDASLLIPTATFDTNYIALAWNTLARRPQTNDYNGFVAIVAPQDGTSITVTPACDVRASTTSSMGVITAGTPTTFVLDAYDVLNLEAVGADAATITGPDLSGTIITSADTKTFGVFAGTEASVIPSDQPDADYENGPCCADHLEEMMFPTSTWGKNFAVARSQVRLTSKPERDVLRVLAQKAGTTVTFSPAPAKGTCGTLGVGQFCQVEISGDTAITANQPIMVGHYLVSAIWQDDFGDSEGTGDPSESIAVPVEQFRSSYTILVPSQYDQNYVSLALATNDTAQIDGTDVTSQLAAFAGMYKGGRLTLTAGPHTITCTGGGCGIELYGYSDAVSYMVPGGLDLKQIVVN